MLGIETTEEKNGIIFIIGYTPESNSYEKFFLTFKHLLNAFLIGNLLRVNVEI